MNPDIVYRIFSHLKGRDLVRASMESGAAKQFPVHDNALWITKLKQDYNFAYKGSHAKMMYKGLKEMFQRDQWTIEDVKALIRLSPCIYDVQHEVPIYVKIVRSKSMIGNEGTWRAIQDFRYGRKVIGIELNKLLYTLFTEMPSNNFGLKTRMGNTLLYSVIVSCMKYGLASANVSIVVNRTPQKYFCEVAPIANYTVLHILGMTRLTPFHPSEHVGMDIIFKTPQKMFCMQDYQGNIPVIYFARAQWIFGPVQVAVNTTSPLDIWIIAVINRTPSSAFSLKNKKGQTAIDFIIKYGNPIAKTALREKLGLE